MKRHRWVVIAPFDITTEDGLRLIGEIPTRGAGLAPTEILAGEPPAVDDERPWLGLHNLARELMQVACYECEQQLTPKVAYTECPGDPGTPKTNEGIVTANLGGIGRNDPCPCGSGKKFKHCCLD
jgi:SEC-C motif